MAPRDDDGSAAPSPRRTLRREAATGARQERTSRRQGLLRLASPFVLLLLWEGAARGGLLDVRFFPPPTSIFASAGALLADGTLEAAVAISLRRLAIGFGLGATVGILVGLWLGLSAWSRALIEPWIQLTYPVPKLALYPLLVLVVGLGEPPIIVLLAITTGYIVVINTIAGVLSIARVYLDVGRDCGARFDQFFFTIALPASLPHIFAALEIALGIAYVVLIAAEFVGANTGLGRIIWTSWQLFDVAPMYVAIVTVSVLGYLSVVAIRALGDRVTPWRRYARG